MSDGVRFELKGFEVLQARLDALPGPAARRVVVAGLRQGAQAIKKAAKGTAPERQKQRDRIITLGALSTRVRAPGFLRRTVIYRSVRGELAILVGPMRGAFYGAFFEFGRSGRPMPRVTWLRSAFGSSVDVAFGRISAGLWDQLKKEVDKLG